MIIGFLGAKNCGKSTAVRYLSKYGFVKDSFANPIKDVCSTLFGWDREMLEGETLESRIWREQVDVFWAEKLGIPNFTPRMAMNIIGTDLMREQFNKNIWIYVALKKYSHFDQNAAFGDCRHINETDEIIRQGGIVARIETGPLPEWKDIAAKAVQGDVEALAHMNGLGIHQSEYEWLVAPYTHVLKNDSDIPAFEARIEEFYRSIT